MRQPRARLKIVDAGYKHTSIRDVSGSLEVGKDDDIPRFARDDDGRASPRLVQDVDRHPGSAARLCRAGPDRILNGRFSGPSPASPSTVNTSRERLARKDEERWNAATWPGSRCGNVGRATTPRRSNCATRSFR